MARMKKIGAKSLPTESMLSFLSDETSDETTAVDDEADIGSAVETLEMLGMVTSLIDGRSVY